MGFENLSTITLAVFAHIISFMCRLIDFQLLLTVEFPIFCLIKWPILTYPITYP